MSGHSAEKGAGLIGCPADGECAIYGLDPCDLSAGRTGCQMRRPMMGCGYVDHDDGTCLHPLNWTPECHQWVNCPVLELRVTSPAVGDGS